MCDQDRTDETMLTSEHPCYKFVEPLKQHILLMYAVHIQYVLTKKNIVLKAP